MTEDLRAESPEAPPPHSTSSSNTLGLIAFISALLGACIPIFAPIGLVLGIIAWAQRRRNAAPAGLAIAGTLLGLLFVGLWIGMLFWALDQLSEGVGGFGLPPKRGRVVEVELATGKRQVLGELAGVDLDCPRYTPSGRILVDVRLPFDERGTREVADQAFRPAVPTPPEARVATAVAEAPDGRLALSRDLPRGQGSGVFVRELSGEERLVYTNRGDRVERIEWAPDGLSIAFDGSIDGDAGVVEVILEEDAADFLLYDERRGFLFVKDLDWAGPWIAARTSNGLFVLDLVTGDVTPVPMTELDGGARVVDGQLYFTALDARAIPDMDDLRALRRRTLPDGPTETVYTARQRLRCFDVHPQGDRLLIIEAIGASDEPKTTPTTPRTAP